MNLDEAQRQQVAKWIEEGLKLSEIQTKLASEFDLRMTYMEVRFLIDDLQLKPKDKEPPPAPVVPKAAPPPSPGRQPAAPPDQETDFEEEPLPGAANVSVSVDHVTRP